MCRNKHVPLTSIAIGGQNGRSARALGDAMVGALFDALLVWVLVLSLAYKLARPQAYLSALPRYTALVALGPRQSRVLAWLTAAGEATTITLLLTPNLRPLGAGLAGAQFLCYSLVIVMDRREHIADCGCWGLKLVSTRRGLLVRNGILIFAAVALLTISNVASPSSYSDTIVALLLTIPFALFVIESPTLLRVIANK
jgi:hypothetical protein